MSHILDSIHTINNQENLLFSQKFVSWNFWLLFLGSASNLLSFGIVIFGKLLVEKKLLPGGPIGGGGFIPMGAKPKADDVPAMLSKDEFVMTRDAVKGMGGGDANVGAQRMYDLMNQLEAKV